MGEPDMEWVTVQLERFIEITKPHNLKTFAQISDSRRLGFFAIVVPETATSFAKNTDPLGESRCNPIEAKVLKWRWIHHPPSRGRST